MRHQATLLFLATFAVGCSDPSVIGYGDQGGAGSLLTIHMPFERGYRAICTQGPGGKYSHRATSTKYDVDFDTPNNQDDIIVAPISGMAFVHDTPNSGFGRHVNIAVGDGTYIVIAHMDKIFIEDDARVGLGQVIGFEGNTGNSTGDHVHIGRHLGDADQDASKGQSLPTLAFHAVNATIGASEHHKVGDMICGLPGGHAYVSTLPSIQSHPDGTLVKTPYDSAVYLVNDGDLEVFVTEGDFFGGKFSFENTVMVTPSELSCYGRSSSFAGPYPSYFQANGHDWLILADDGRDEFRSDLIPPHRVSQILESWGLSTADSEHGPIRYPDYGYQAGFRDGTLVKENGNSTLYVMSNNVAMPIESYDLLSRLGLASSDYIRLPFGELENLVSGRGSCAGGKWCIDADFVESCGVKSYNVPNADMLQWSDMGSVSDRPDPGYDTGNSGSSGSGSSGSSSSSGSGSGSSTSGSNSSGGSSSSGSGSSGSSGGGSSSGGSSSGGSGSSGSGSSGGSSGSGSGSGSSSNSGTLNLTWNGPGSTSFDRITMSGTWNGGWWQNLANTSNRNSITLTEYSVNSGDSLRFSVEFEEQGSVSWSCLAPFPPGTLQGHTTATWNGQSLTVRAVADPASSGCTLRVDIP